MLLYQDPQVLPFCSFDLKMTQPAPLKQPGPLNKSPGKHPRSFAQNLVRSPSPPPNRVPIESCKNPQFLPFRPFDLANGSTGPVKAARCQLTTTTTTYIHCNSTSGVQEDSVFMQILPLPHGGRETIFQKTLGSRRSISKQFEKKQNNGSEEVMTKLS